MSKILFSLILTLLFTSCSSGLDVSQYPKAGQFPGTINTVPERSTLPELTVGLINTGYNEGPKAFAYDGGSWFSTHKSVFTAILVKHPRATLLIDAGLGKEIDKQTAINSAMDNMLLSYKKLTPAVTQLQKQGVAPAQIQMIIASHLHWDHASGIKDFPESKVWVQKQELEYAKTVSPPNVLQSQFDGDAIKWNFYTLSNKSYENFARSLDVFGDGSIVMVPLGGHSSGMVGVFVNFRSGKRLFFSSDATWTLEGIKNPAEKSSIVISMFGPDRDRMQTRKDIIQLHRLSKKYPQLHIIPAHDDTAYQKLKYFPHLITH